MLGTWNITTSDLELNDHTNPLCLRPYPIPRVHEEMLKKEVKIIASLGVLEEANDSKWGSLSFVQLKAKNNCVRFSSDFWN